MSNKWSKIKWVWQEAQGLWTERSLTSQATLTEVHKFALFWLLAGKSFVRNRCPVHGSWRLRPAAGGSWRRNRWSWWHLTERC